MAGPRRFTELSDGEKELFERANALAKPMLHTSAVVIDLGSDNQMGSGLLVRYRSERWIATAAHVARAALSRDTRICWGPPGSAADYHDVSFADCALAWQPADDADVAAILLSDRVPLEGATFIPAEQCSRETAAVLERDLVWIVGTPQAQRDADRQLHGLADAQSQILLHTSEREDCIASGEHAEDAGGDVRRSEDDFHLDWSSAMQPAGSYKPLFRAGGMSGAPVWSARLGDASLWTPQSAVVIAIAWYQNWATRCVRASPFGCWFSAADACLSVVHEMIALRAWSRYEARGKTHGHDLDDWLAARAEFHERR